MDGRGNARHHGLVVSVKVADLDKQKKSLHVERGRAIIDIIYLIW
jgi:hypothetical protein